MNAFLLLYALAISIELVLSLLMALFLFLIMSPRRQAEAAHPPAAQPRPPAGDLQTALRDAFATISRGEDDLLTLTNARMLLARYARERVESDRQGGAPMSPGPDRGADPS